MLRSARDFFHERNVVEVDCPALSSSSPIDLHIDVMKVALNKGEIGYLHTSPEYGMKRLLSPTSAISIRSATSFAMEKSDRSTIPNSPWQSGTGSALPLSR